VKPTFFATPADFRAWLEKNHAKATELLVGFYKKTSGRASLTWPESVDEALCFGWIDGVRRSLGDEAYTIRFTPRRPRSIWSAINIAKVQQLTKAGLMRPAGKAAFAKRTDDRSAIYSFEQRKAATLDAGQERLFRANKKAWAFFSAQPPGYRKVAVFYVTSAKKEETRLRRLERLIGDSQSGRRIGLLERREKSR
jgi:uncharacterized protein YdeI (YjbR/CyaY-like superfamily)